MAEPESREDFVKAAHRRLYPPITDPNYLVLRSRRLIFRNWIQRLSGNDWKVLDVGGRYQPYRPLLDGRCQRYVALDISKTPLVNVIARGEQLPFADATFDVVLSTSVFDYIPEPRIAAAEIHRALKPGGHFLLSVASMYPRIAEEEYWRFLPSGLKFVLAPFSQIEIVPEVTSIGGFLRLTAVALSIFAKYNWLRWIVQHSIVPVLNITGLALESLKLTNNDQITGNFSVLVRK